MEKPKQEDKSDKGKRSLHTKTEQIKLLEDELKNTKYNKRTQGAVGILKAKIAKLREDEEKRSSSGKKGEGYTVRKSGDGTAILIGFPSVGKSTLLNALTNAESKTASYAFTTLTCIPGTLQYNSAKIQILDVPGILRGAARGLGRGKEVISVVRNADLVIFIVDVFDIKQLEVLKKELYDANMRVNERKPDVKLKKDSKGGIRVASTVKLTQLDDKTIKAVMTEMKMNNATIVIREDITVDQLIDCIEDNKKYIPAIVVLNKIDMVDSAALEKVKKHIGECIPVSAEKGENIDLLKEEIFTKLDFLRIYMKEVGQKPDLDVPLIMKTGCTIKMVCEKIHKDFVPRFKFAKIWGKSAKFPGQKLMLEHVLRDGDIIELHLR
ncbi:MAG: GTP-binding protein [Nanoarchaeota archaeon]|nr:GTP-binding protein [Nanoarchaeota archaeon]